MKKGRIAMVLLVGTVLVSGFSCSEGSLDILACVPSVCMSCGKYVSEADSSHSIEIRDDGTAYLYEGGLTQKSGTWHLSGTDIIINWQGYPATRAEFRGNAVIDDHGIVWWKQ